MSHFEKRTLRATRLLNLLEPTGIEVDASEHRLQEYSYDASNYRVRPEIVAFPCTVEEMRLVLQAASEVSIPITIRGGGTSMAGNAIGDGLVIDASRRMTSIDDIDIAARTVWVDAGVVLGELRSYVERLSEGELTFAPDPSSLSRATVGGSFGNDACGNHSVEYGRMSHHIIEVELLTIDGAHLIASEGGVRAADSIDQHSMARAVEINDALTNLANSNLAPLRVELQTIPRQVSGYHLGHLLPENGFNIARVLAGSEGTCAVIVRAKVSLVKKPGPTAMLCVGYDNTIDSARDVTAILEWKPSAVEGINSEIIDIMRHRRGEESVSSLPAGNAYLMIEFSDESIEAAAEKCEELALRLRKRGFAKDHVIALDPIDRAKLWRVREDGAGLSSRRLDGVQTWPGWEDSAVAPAHLADYLAELLPAIEEYGYQASIYGHFGAGCVHMRLDFELWSAEGRANFESFMRKAVEIVMRHGGSLSGEHGDGRARSSLLDHMYSPKMLKLFEAFKDIWDPQNLLNPGIIVKPVPYTEALSLEGLPHPHSSISLPYPTVRSSTLAGSDSSLNESTTLGVFAGNAHACIGVGRCRATSGGFMCPSYRASKDEKDSTRGRARVLQELARGQKKSSGGWSKPEVQDSLDLCLSCKACSSDCPTGVDIAEAKSQLLNDHYRGKFRPFTHYSIGWLPRWLPIITRLSGLSNKGMKIRILRWLGAKLGISARRQLPAFIAHRELKKKVKEAQFSANANLLVFADSFTKAFRPEVIPAAARVLRSTGAEVGCTPDACCGLTWISTGQRDGAAKRLARLVQQLDDGTDRDIVVLEPSCAAAIRDDGPKLVKNDAAVRVSRRVRSFSVAIDEAIERGWVPSVSPPKCAVLQIHCHEHAVFGSQSQRRVLRKWGVADILESSSCCGVAGNFGFESEHFDFSMRVAEHSIIPALKEGEPDALVLTDGFSCNLQVSQISPLRDSKHLATALDPLDSETQSPLELASGKRD